MNNHAHIIAPLGDMTSSFLVNWFNAFDWMPYVSGTTRLKLTQGQMREAGFRVPPLNEQKRIVAKLDALQARADAAKQALDAIPPLLEKFRRSVLAAAFRGDLTREWRARNPDVEPASELLARIRAERRRRWEEANPKKKYVEPEPVDTSELPELPEGWCWATVEQLCWDGPTNGYSGNTDGDARGTLTMKLSATTSGQMRLDASTTKRLNESLPADAKYWMEPGDLLVQRANSLEYIGAAAVFRGYPEPIIYPDLMMRLRTTRTSIGDLLWRYFNSSLCRGWFRSMATGTAGNMPKINGAVLRSTRIPVPPGREVEALLRKIESTFDGIAAAEASALSLLTYQEQMDRAILAKAFRGELVPQDPNDEPAEVLLERIRAERVGSEGGGKKRRGRARS